MAINYELLKTFVAAAEAGSFRAAAQARFVTISAVSQQIKALEVQLGVPLFARLGRRVALTAEGRELAAALQPAFASVDDALDRARDAHHEVAGVLRIGAPRAFARSWAHPRLVGLLDRHAGLTLRLELGVPSLLERRLSDGLLDLALLAREARLPTLETRAVAVERFVAVASPGYLKRWGRPRTADEFRRHRYAVFDPELAMHAPWWRAWFGPRALLPRAIVVEAPSLDQLVAHALDGVCLAIVPSYLIDDHVAARRLKILEPTSRRVAPDVSNTIYLAWRRSAVESARLVAARAALSA